MAIHYILNILFLISFSFSCIYYGPVLIYHSISLEENKFEEATLKYFYFDDYPNKNSYKLKNKNIKIDSSLFEDIKPNYYQILIQFDTVNFKRIYHKSDSESKNLVNFLISEKIISSTSKVDFNKTLPLTLKSKQLNSSKVYYRYNSKNKIKFLKLNDTVLLGLDFGLFGQIIQFIFGFVLFLLGPSMLVIGTIVIRNNLKYYKETGILPRLTDKTKGLKFIFGLKN